MTTRCRYSEYGKEMLRPQKSGRIGTIIDVNKRGHPIVRWDGNRAEYNYHPDFIEVFDPDEKICTIDLSRAPVLRELLGLSENATP